ncbi:MAG: hypothetical protein Q9180_007695, partial [Flavoplaca navasiana]
AFTLHKQLKKDGPALPAVLPPPGDSPRAMVALRTSPKKPRNAQKSPKAAKKAVIDLVSDDGSPTPSAKPSTARSKARAPPAKRRRLDPIPAKKVHSKYAVGELPPGLTEADLDVSALVNDMARLDIRPHYIQLLKPNKFLSSTTLQNMPYRHPRA